MASSEARIDTGRAARYLDQLCKHATAIGAARHRPRMHLNNELTRGQVRVHADRDDTHATITFTPWGQCTITANPSALTLRLDATNDQNLHRIQDTLTRNLERFGGREHLSLTWQRPTSTPTTPPARGQPPQEHRPTGHRDRQHQPAEGT